MGAVDPQQEIFSRLKKDITEKGYAVYDGFLPPENTPYPFVYLGNFQQTDSANKSAVFGSVYAMIHVWSDSPRSRGTVSAMLLDIKTICRQIEHTDNFSWLVQSMTQSIMEDTTTKSPLLHGVVQVNFLFS